MSVSLMSKVWGMPGVNQTEMLLLLALADRANDDGVCWPGQASLAAKCNTTDRTIRRALKSLESKNLIEITHRQGDGEGRKTNIYRLTIDRLPDNMSGGATGHSGQATGHSGYGNRTQVSAYTSEDTSEDTSVRDTAPKKTKPDSFKEFFSLYPANRKGGSDRSAWDKAKAMKLTDDDFKLIVEDVRERLAKDAQWEQGYVLGICKYLDQEIWKTPITLEQNHGQTKRSNQPIGEVARIQARIDERAKARAEAIQSGRGDVYEG